MARPPECFFFFFLSVLNLFTYFIVYRGGPVLLLQRQLYFSKDQRGPTLLGGGGVQLFPGGGPNAKFYSNPYNL